MNRGRLVTRVGNSFGLTTDIPNEELTLLQEWLQDGVVDVLLRTHCRSEIGDMGLTAGIAEYRIDTNILAILNGRVSSLAGLGDYTVVTMSEVLDMQVVNLVGGGTEKFIAIEGDMMIVQPTPTTGDTIRFVYIARPQNMTNDTDDPSNATFGGIPPEYHYGIEDFMNWKAATYDQRRGSPVSAKDFHDIYIANCATIRKNVKRKQGRGLAPAKVGYPGRRLSSRNDTYPTRYDR